MDNNEKSVPNLLESFVTDTVDFDLEKSKIAVERAKNESDYELRDDYGKGEENA